MPYLRVANVQEGFLDTSLVKTISASQETIEKLRLQKGDILLNEGCDRDKLGRGWVWNNEIKLCIHQNHVFRARLFNKEFIPEFISSYSNIFGKSYFFTEGVHTTNLASISMSKIKLFPIPIPPIEEQKIIYSFIQDITDTHKSMQEFLRNSCKNVDMLRQSILNDAYTGKL